MRRHPKPFVYRGSAGKVSIKHGWGYKLYHALADIISDVKNWLKK